MIDKNKLIKDLEKAKSNCKHLFELVFFDGVMAIVENQPQADNWIPVSERLPEESGYYLVTQVVHSLKDFNEILRSDVEYVEFCHGEWKRARHLEVIAWQNLPQKYEVKQL